MADITVIGQAAQQLRPLENSNIGAIFEENIRYWNAVNNKEEALRKTAAAREAEFNRKSLKDANDRIDNYNGNMLEDDDSSGYLNYSVSESLAITNEIEMKNRDAVLNGTPEERFAAMQENLQWRNSTIALSKLNTASNSITENTKEDDYNPALDYKSRELAINIKTGGYALNRANGKMYLKSREKGGEDIEVSQEELLSTIKSLKYSGYTNFDKLGDEASDSISQDKINDNIVTTKSNKELALGKARGIMSNERYAREMAAELNIGGAATNPRAYDNFTTDQKEQISVQFSSTYIEGKLKTERNDINNAVKLKTLNEDVVTSNAQINTDGVIPDEVNINETIIPLDSGELAFIPQQGAKKVTFNLDGNDAVYAGHSVQKNGTIKVFGVVTTEEEIPVLDSKGKPIVEQQRNFDLDENNQPIPETEIKNGVTTNKTNDDGDPIFKSSFKEVPKTKKVNQDRVITTQNPTVVTSVFGTIGTATGGVSVNPTETARSYQKKRNETFDNKASTKQTREQRIAAMAAAIKEAN